MSYLKDFKYVIAIAKHGGISGAADFLNIAQSALSRYLKKIEDELGVELFDRSSLPLRPTDAGKRYIATGKKIIALQAQLEKELEEIKNGKNSFIRIGISPSRSPYIMPAIIKAYREKNPDTKIKITEKTTTELANLLSSGELDLVINILDEGTENFEKVELFEEGVLVAVAKDNHPELKKAQDILLSTPLVTVGKGQAMWQTTTEIASSMGIREPEIECQSIESALALVKHGIGAMILPDYIANFDNGENNRLLRFISLSDDESSLPKKSYKRQICIFYRKEQFLTQTERDFIECVKSTVVNKIKKG